MTESEADVLLKDGQLLYQQGIMDGYNKAIDEAIEIVKGNYRMEALEKLEQLKVRSNMDDFETKLENEILFTLDRLRMYERSKAIDDLIEAAEKSQYGDVDGKEYVMGHLKALAERLKECDKVE